MRLLYVKLCKLSILVMITFLSSCSSTKLIYTLAGEFIEDEISYFLKLEKEEEVFLKKKVSEIVAWHRKSMLPSYGIFLNDMADKLEIGENYEDDISYVLTNGKYLIEQTVTGLIPFVSEFLVRYNSLEAISFMEKKMEIRQKERLEELEKPHKERYENRMKKLTLNFERFFGDLTNAQVSLINAHTSSTLGEAKTRFYNRTMRQKAFVKFLRTQPNKKELIFFLNKLLISGHLIVNPSYKEFSEISLYRFKTLLVNMLSISSIVQRDIIIKKLRDYADDFKTVSE